MRFWTSDLHLGHRNIISYCNRPWETVDEMNEGLIQRWNEVVGPDDSVNILGDLAMGIVLETLPLAARLNGHKRLLPGNHDRCWEHFHDLSNGHRKLPLMSRLWADRYRELADLEVITYGKPSFARLGIGLESSHIVKLSHFPYQPDERHGERLAEYHPTDEGLLLLHGHVHQEWKRRGRQINVGVDVWDYRPVSDEQLLSFIEETEGEEE